MKRNTLFHRALVVGMIACSAWALISCNEEEDSSYDLTIDTFNVGLAGAFIDNEEERRQPIADAIAALDSDVICLQEVWRQSDKDLIISTAESTFPYAVSFQHDLNTTVDDPTDQNGDTPELPDTAPCTGGQVDILESALTCLKDNCSTIPGSDEGQTTSTDCASENCTSAVANLLLSGPEGLRCYGCIAPNLPTETFADLRDACTTDPNAGLAFGGQSGVMILSKHPVSNTEAYVLPGTWNRRVIVRATVDLPNSTSIDVYCNHLTPIFDGLTYPYTGYYGEGETDKDGWEAEQLLQAGKLIDYVNAETGDGVAFILGDFNAGRDYGDTIVKEGLDTLELLESAFTPAITEDFTPVCTHCPDNPIANDAGDPVWIDHIFMANVPASAVVSTEVTFTEASVAVDGGSVTLSDHYGLRSVVTLE